MSYLMGRIQKGATYVLQNSIQEVLVQSFQLAFSLRSIAFENAGKFHHYFT